MKSRGFTVAEVLISGTLLLLLSILLIAGWTKGVQAWKTVEQKNEVVTQAQRFIRLVERELEASSPSGVETSDDPPCLSFPSTFDVDARREFAADNDSGALHWQKQVVYYHTVEAKEIWRRELAVTPGTEAYISPTPISRIDLGSGLRPVSSYAFEGQPIAREIQSVDFEQDGLEVTMTLSVKTSSEAPSTFVSTTVLRN